MVLVVVLLTPSVWAGSCYQAATKNCIKMEEVDSIILHFLRQLNVNIDENIRNICDLSVETIIESASTCLRAINQTLKVPVKLPSGISHRIEVAALIASFCKDLGYKNDVGYQTFLYYNETELRQVFMFLIENLPTEGKKISSAPTLEKKRSLLMQEISNKIGEELKSIWIPPCCKPTSLKIGDFEVSDSYFSSLSLPDERQLIEKLLKVKENKVESLNEHKPKETSTEEELKHETDKTLKELKEMAIVLQQKVDTLESEKNMMDVEYTQTQKSCEKVEADLKNVKQILESIGILDDDSELIGDNLLIDKVQNNINKLHRKSEELTLRNLTLKSEVEKLKISNASTESERAKCKKTLTILKDNAKSLKDEYDKKETIRNQMRENYEKLRKGNKRSVYTKRILEIISNVDKQNMEIKKILEDTREIQKEINTLEGQLDRCFSIADETLFRDAKKDDQAKKAYKLLALLHSECNTIVTLVNDMGVVSREIVDFEENIKTETAKRTEDTLKKIQEDLSRMQQEY